MPAALPGVGPALPTAGSLSGAHATVAAQGTVGAAALLGDAAGDAALMDALPQLDFKTLFKQGLGAAAGDAPVKATDRKLLPATPAASGDALASAIAALVPQMQGALPVAFASHTADYAAATPAGGNALAAGAALTAGATVAMSARTQAHHASQLETGAAPKVDLTAATDPAKIAAAGQVLPQLLPQADKPAHALAATTSDTANNLLSVGNLAAMHTAGSAANAVDAAPLPGNPPVSSPAFADALGEKMVWMSKNDLQAAHLQLNPPELGPLSIHLTVNDNQVSAFFVSPHEPVREAIAAALPRLQEMMSGSGMTLGQANVGSESSANPNANQGQTGRQPGWQGLASTTDSVDVAPTAWRPLSLSRGGVDTFV